MGKGLGSSVNNKQGQRERERGAGEGATVRGAVTAGGTSAMAAAHARQRAQTVHRSLLPNTPSKELGQLSFLSRHPGERALAARSPLSLTLPSLSGCLEPSGSRRGQEVTAAPHSPSGSERSGTG